MKYLKNTKQILDRAVDRGWLIINPIKGFSCTYEHPERNTLTMHELIKMQQKALITRLAEVRDVYLFCCFTGFAYAEVFNLEPGNIFMGLDGRRWVSKNRQKTDSPETVPLLPIAENIIGRYLNHPYCKVSNRLLPVNSNQRFNSYLREVADLCGIEKLLTTHTARHTFATTVTLENDVPLETVSKMLGHKSIRTTQIYAKITQKKVSNNMLQLESRIFDENGLLKIL